MADEVDKLRAFYFKYGREKAIKTLEILNDGNPAPQQRVARVLGIGKSAVSELLKPLIRWRAELATETLAEQFKLLIQFDAYVVQQGSERLHKIAKRTPILAFPDGRNHRA